MPQDSDAAYESNRNEIAGNRREIDRLRDRLHTLESSVTACKLLIDDVREWRAEIRVWQRGVNETLQELSTADEIANAVADAVQDRMTTNSRLRLTRVQTVIAGCAVGATIAAPILAVVLKGG